MRRGRADSVRDGATGPDRSRHNAARHGGFEATRRIKAAWPRIVIVMHSSSDMPVYRDASLAAGAAAFVGKGRNSRTLVPIIAGLLPARSVPTSP